ncbi:MAG: hypothetical protein ACFNLL_08795, partial [Bacteroides sp.]
MVLREIRRNANKRNGTYKAELVQRKYTERMVSKPKACKFTDVVTDSAVRYPTMRVGKDSNQTVGFAYDSGAQAYKMYLS